MFIFALLLLAQPANPKAAPAPVPTSGQFVLKHLKQTIAWYEHIGAANRGASAPSDVLIQDSIHASSTQVVKLAFAFARNEANRFTSNGEEESAATADVSPAVAKANDRVSHLQSQIDSLTSGLPKAPRKNRKILESQITALNADLKLAKAVQTSLRQMVSLATAPGTAQNGGLLASVDELASVVPAVDSGSEQPPERNAAPAFQADSAGILELASQAFSAARKRVEIAGLLTNTQALLTETEGMVAPLRNEFRNAISVGDNISGSIGSQTDPAQIEAERKQAETLSSRIKQISTLGAPLAGQRIAIQASISALQQWNSETVEQYDAATRYLVLRTAVLAAIIIFVLVAGEALTRLAYRYVHDSRRRRQVMLIRRFAVGAAITLVILLTVFHGFGSFATIAGFVTAGLAVALQNVIVSIVAYFFLIGRYGLRVGDIVTVTSITGEVVEIGLLRFYLVELSGSDIEVHSTGRIAVFSNSVIFQPSALLKHPSKTQYVWHLVRVTLESDTDPQTAQERVTRAVQTVYEEYRQGIEHQNEALGDSFASERSKPRLTSRVRFTDSGCEITVRYPVDVERAPEIDNRVIRRVLDQTNSDPKLSLAATGAPRVETAA